MPSSAPRPSAAAGGRGVLLALAAALVFGVAGGGTAYLLLKDKEQPTRGGGSAQGDQKGDGGTQAGATPTPKATKSEPKPVVYKGVNLTAGYHLTLGDDEVRPQAGRGRLVRALLLLNGAPYGRGAE
ncbi:hypothetical protein ACF05T_27440 [Streptomyces lateritius]|uniref:LytR family transcriptional regulator n=1 Tax=Streptomyces lateritius TaxID=67313 RepID=A0ABW6YIV8_9ACTN